MWSVLVGKTMLTGDVFSTVDELAAFVLQLREGSASQTGPSRSSPVLPSFCVVSQEDLSLIVALKLYFYIF